VGGFDLVVVGGGFAGLACARAASARGLATAVLDAKDEPGARPHTTGLLVKEVADLLDPPTALTRRIARIRLYSPDLRHVDLASPGYYFLATDTPGLLRWLAEEASRAGAYRFGGRRVTGIERTARGWTLSPGGVTARYLVGADGPRSRVARTTGLGRNRSFLVGVEAEMTGVRGVDPGCLHCLLDSRLAPGYLAWVVPGVHAVQVGLACRPPHRPDLRALVGRLSRRFDFGNARIVGRRGGVIPVGGPVRPLGRDSVLLVGDAAGMVSPLTAGGIHTALGSGRLAGQAIAEHLRHGDPDPARVLSREMPRFRVKRWLRRALDLRPPNVVYDALLADPLFRSLAATLFFHHRGLFTGAAWREVAATLFRAA